MSGRFDLILAGGGLASSLIAYRLKQRRPALRLLILEAGDRLGGNHTWSFHVSDLTPAQRDWTAPFVVNRWPFYDVAFPDLRRRVDLAYASATSDRLHAVTIEAGLAVRFGADVRSVSPTTVELAGGETLEAAAVIDGRGGEPTPHLRLGWQKFVGHEVRTAAPHRLAGPILMDATVPQHDGYRFVYVLPFAPDRLLIEDTYYSDGPDLESDRLRGHIADYAAARGWTIAEHLRDEAGVLPIVLAGDIDAFWAAKRGQPCAGLRAGLFHATTGFSWPDAVRLADHVADLPDLGAAPLFAAVRAYATRHWKAQGFFRALDRMLFLAGDADRRWAMMQRFYRFSDPLVARFYAGALTPVDKVQLLVGRPPVSVTGAVRALLDTRVSTA